MNQSLILGCLLSKVKLQSLFEVMRTTFRRQPSRKVIKQEQVLALPRIEPVCLEQKGRIKSRREMSVHAGLVFFTCSS